MSAVDDAMAFADRVMRDLEAEIDVTWDAALVAGWMPEQLRVENRAGRVCLSAVHRGSEHARLVEVWIERSEDGMSLCVKRVEKMPDPLPVEPPKKSHLSGPEIIERCRAIVERGNKPALPDVRPLIDSFYELDGNGAGGQLHVVLDDHNVQLPHIEWCERQAQGRRDFVAMWLARVLKMLSASQRRRM